MALLSVLTPTYNRAGCLATLFKSLCAQTNQGFEWWVIDDGSTDETKSVVRSFQTQSAFPIHYIYKENGGKHTALNAAISQITSELTMIVDSDDTLTDNAVEIIDQYHRKYGGRPGLCGYVFLRKFSNGQISGKQFVPDERVASYIDVRINGNDTHADKAEVFYTKCLHEFPFPEFPGEKFLGEDVVWLQMGRKYDTIHINQAIYQFEYRDDGLTNNRRRHNIASPKGCTYRGSLYLEKDIKLRYRLKGALQYLTYGKFAGYGLRELLSRTRYKFLVGTMILPSCIFYIKWKQYT